MIAQRPLLVNILEHLGNLARLFRSQRSTRFVFRGDIDDVQDVLVDVAMQLVVKQIQQVGLV